MTFLSSNSDEWSFLTQKIRLFFFFKIYYCKNKQHKSWKVEPDVYKGPESSCRFLEDLFLCQQRTLVFSQVRCSLGELGRRAPYTNSVPGTEHMRCPLNG